MIIISIQLYMNEGVYYFDTNNSKHLSIPYKKKEMFNDTVKWLITFSHPIRIPMMCWNTMVA